MEARGRKQTALDSTALTLGRLRFNRIHCGMCTKSFVAHASRACHAVALAKVGLLCLLANAFGVSFCQISAARIRQFVLTDRAVILPSMNESSVVR